MSVGVLPSVVCCVCFKPSLTSLSQNIACEIVKVAFFKMYHLLVKSSWDNVWAIEVDMGFESTGRSLYRCPLLMDPFEI